MNTQSMWTAQRDPIPSGFISKLSARYDRDRTIDRKRVAFMKNQFKKWYDNEAEFQIGIETFGRALNFTLSDDYDDL